MSQGDADDASDAGHRWHRHHHHHHHRAFHSTAMNSRLLFVAPHFSFLFFFSYPFFSVLSKLGNRSCGISLRFSVCGCVWVCANMWPAHCADLMLYTHTHTHTHTHQMHSICLGGRWPMCFLRRGVGRGRWVDFLLRHVRPCAGPWPFVSPLTRKKDPRARQKGSLLTSFWHRHFFISNFFSKRNPSTQKKNVVSRHFFSQENDSAQSSFHLPIQLTLIFHF